VRIAALAGMKLKIAAKVDAADREYFSTRIEPLLNGSNVEYLGEISDAEKSTFLGEAAGLIFPNRVARTVRPRDDRRRWPAGPSHRFRRGSVPEVVDPRDRFIVDGRSGRRRQWRGGCLNFDRARSDASSARFFTASRMTRTISTVIAADSSRAAVCVKRFDRRAGTRRRHPL